MQGKSTTCSSPQLSDRSSRQAPAFTSFFELDKMVHQKKKYVTPTQFFYIFSENYQNIDKIVGSGSPG